MAQSSSAWFDHEAEWQTRVNRIDPRLRAEGWEITAFDPARPLSTYSHHAIREYPTENGLADYVLVVYGRILGIIEAKKVALGPQNVLTQAERYSRGLTASPSNWDGFHVPFLYATNGEVIWFHDARHALSRSRKVSRFHTPAALEELLGGDLEAARAWLQQHPNTHPRLRPYQVEANDAIEVAIGERKRQMLVAMATGSGKTFTIVNEVYRLMKAGAARRILFLVDRKSLAAQAVRAFASFEPEPGLKFNQVYEVYSQGFLQGDADETFSPSRLPESYLTNPDVKHAHVYVCTIQRMAINLLGPEAVYLPEDERYDDDLKRLDIPIHAFDRSGRVRTYPIGPLPMFGSADRPLMVATNDPSMTSNGIDRRTVQHDSRDDDDEMSAPPHSTQAEEAVLGAVLKRGLAIADVVPFLKPQHFYEARHRYIYAAMAALFERAAAIDYHTIAEELERQGTYEPAGGLGYLSELNLSTPSAAHIEHYARIVLEHAVRRRYIDAAQQVAELAWNRRKDLDTVKARAEALVLGASSDTLSRRAVLPPSEWTAHLMDYLGQAKAGGLAGVSTGLRDLDTITLGLSPGLYLLAAATGTGKTAIAGQIALHVAEQHGPVVFVSMELTDVDLAVRLVSVITNIRKERLVTGALNPEQMEQVMTAIERLSRSRLHIVFGSGYTSADVRAYALQVQSSEEFKPALIVVDYVQLLRDEEGDGRVRERNVSAAARGLKGVSGELSVPVLALVQLNRNRTNRVDKRPQLADLRESGDLENTADSVLGLYRDEIDHPESNDRGLAELSVLKKRQLGEDVGTIRRLVWVGESYSDFTHQSRPP